MAFATTFILGAVFGMMLFMFMAIPAMDRQDKRDEEEASSQMIIVDEIKYARQDNTNNSSNTHHSGHSKRSQRKMHPHLPPASSRPLSRLSTRHMHRLGR